MPYIKNQNSAYATTDECIFLLLYIGRDQEQRDSESGFNVIIDIQRNGLSHAYKRLIKSGLIEITHIDETRIFESCKLTEEGKHIYERLEDSITKMIRDLPFRIL